ncbi:MAG TPA: glycogen debranching N-terminal domain-containing protein [Candidatus Acidoferrum sp.]|nr:glycogen debranching N-terminal domain-containing protein [Candidatus Acidoferrum sp.]
MPVTHGVPTITINHDHQFLVCEPNGTMAATAPVGFFARDTRFVSGYSFSINGRIPLLLDASPIDHFSARWEFTTPDLPLAGTRNGAEDDILLEERAIGIRLDRTIFEGVHEDYDLINYAPMPVRLILEVAIESDFADIFDVRRHRLVRRGNLQSSWHEKAEELRTTYENGSFKRELVVVIERAESHPEFANGRMQFVIGLAPKQTWHACIEWLPVIDGKRGRVLPCGAVQNRDPEMATGVLPPVDIQTTHPVLPVIWRQAVADMEALRMADFAVRRSVFVPAAGIPWYVTLFGRDTLVVAMESISGFPEFAFGAIDRLSRVQATDDNAWQDKEPGKIPHELRYGEIASLGLLPFAPYFGTADATLLFLIVLSYAYQWSGDQTILKRYRTNAEAALNWMLNYGDRDGDGFQEYKTRSPRGFYSQGWKDSHDAIRHADGKIAPLPHALCELQGYAFDALLRMSEAYQIWGEPERAAEMRDRAVRLYDEFNDRFWWEEEGTYYLGLDGDKKPIKSVASNAGHCLANGIVPPDRATRVVDRLMQPDMWSGWGVRTLSTEHPSYNPYSYHLGSVWPHDNATIAGGFRRAGRHDDAQRIAEGIFAAAERFEQYRIPELWAGVAREPGSYPVPYLGTNVPQAWAAASVFRLIAILCGIHTTGQSRTIYVNPDLPEWLPDLTLKNLRAGKGAAELRLKRDQVEVVSNTTGFQIVHGPLPRPPVSETPLART